MTTTDHPDEVEQTPDPALYSFPFRFTASHTPDTDKEADNGAS